MHPNTDVDAFPCPFCGAAAVLLIGGTRVLYYQCGRCVETWTAIQAPAPTEHDSTADKGVEEGHVPTIH